jgi:hypothetical protein
LTHQSVFTAPDIKQIANIGTSALYHVLRELRTRQILAYTPRVARCNGNLPVVGDNC